LVDLTVASMDAMSAVRKEPYLVDLMVASTVALMADPLVAWKVERMVD
jgi:hypothetical protein